MADQDYPHLYEEMEASAQRTRAAAIAFEHVLGGPEADMVPVNGYPDQPTIAGRIKARVDPLVDTLESAAESVKRFAGVHAVAPTTRVNGDPLQPGDEYQNSVEGLRYSWNGSSWIVLNASVQQLTSKLAAFDGATHVGGAQRVVNLRDFCTGDFNWATKTGTSNTLAWRAAIAACRQGDTLLGEPGQIYLLDMLSDGSVVDILDKGIGIDLQTAGVAYKPYLDSDKAGTAAPAIFFGSTQKTTYTTTSGLAFGANILPLNDASGIKAGDYVVVSSNDLMFPWNFPESEQPGIHIGSDVVKVRQVAGNFVSIFGCIQHEHISPPTVTKVVMLEGVAIRNVGPLSGEIDPGVLKTFAAGPRAGHFVSVQDAARPKVEDVQLNKGHRMHAVCFTGCFTPKAEAVRSVSSNPLYRANGGHQYTVSLVTCFGAFVKECEGFGVRHTYDITDCTSTLTQNNLAFDNYGGFNSHGHRDYDWKSIDDRCLNSSDADNAGWTVGNYSFRNSDNVKIVRPFYRGGGVPLTVGFMSTDVNVEDPDVITSSPQALIVASGASRVKVRRGAMRSTSTNPNPAVLLGSNYAIDLGVMTFTAAAGASPAVTVAGTKAHGLPVGKEVWLSLLDVPLTNGQYAGRYTVTSVGSPTAFTATPNVASTTTVALSFTTTWSSMNGRVTAYGNFKPIGSVEVTSSVTKDAASQLGVISYSGNGRLTTGGYIGSGASSRYAIRIHGLLASGSASFNVSDLQLSGEHWGPVILDNARLGERCNFSRVKSGSHTMYALQAVGLSLASVQAAGLTFTDNELETTAATGVLNFHPFPVMFTNPGKLLIRGNTYGTGYTSELGYNYERGSWTPKAGAATITTQPTYANQMGRYAFDGSTLTISFRVEWSGLVGTGDGFVDGFPFALSVPYNHPAAVAEFAATGMVTGDVPLLSMNSQTRLVLRKLNGPVTGPIAAPGMAQMVGVCSIPVC